MTTKIPAELSSTPGISDSSNATAITIDSSENVIVGATSYNNDNAGVGLGSSGFFYATRDGSLAASFKRLSSTGSIADFRKDSSTIASVTSDGICFGSDSAAANALDDYEEGTFNPAYSATGLTVTMDIQNGHYTKIGNMVYFGLLVGTDAVSGGSTNQLKITGLPYPSVNSTTKLSSGAVGLSYLFTSGQNNMKWFIGANSSEISFYIGDDNNVASVQPSSVLNSGANQNRLYITGFYITA